MKGDLDFEEFSVSAERAQAVRSDIEKLKASGWLEELRLLAAELGVEDASIGTVSGQQMDLGPSHTAKAYKGAAGSAVEGLAVIATGTDFFVRWKERILLEVMQLPKAGDFAILQIDSALWEAMPAIREQIKDDLKLAKQLKSDRQAQFKSFSK